jgi:L-serine deaminase
MPRNVLAAIKEAAANDCALALTTDQVKQLDAIIQLLARDVDPNIVTNGLAEWGMESLTRDATK